jgi:hypothetical protein
MTISATAVLGAAVGAVFGAASALFVVSAVAERLRALDRSEAPPERAALERKILALRWIVVGIETVVFAVLGYWVGSWLFD